MEKKPKYPSKAWEDLATQPQNREERRILRKQQGLKQKNIGPIRYPWTHLRMDIQPKYATAPTVATSTVLNILGEIDKSFNVLRRWLVKPDAKMASFHTLKFADPGLAYVQKELLHVPQGYPENIDSFAFEWHDIGVPKVQGDMPRMYLFFSGQEEFVSIFVPEAKDWRILNVREAQAVEANPALNSMTALARLVAWQWEICPERLSRNRKDVGLPKNVAHYDILHLKYPVWINSLELEDNEETLDTKFADNGQFLYKVLRNA